MNATLVLASASPRRRQLVEMLGIPFLLHPALVQEIPLPREDLSAVADKLNRRPRQALDSDTPADQFQQRLRAPWIPPPFFHPSISSESAASPEG